MKDLITIILITAPWILYFIERDKRLGAEKEAMLLLRRRDLDGIGEELDATHKKYHESLDRFNTSDVHIPGSMLDGISGGEEIYLSSGALQGAAQASTTSEKILAIEAIGYGEPIIVETMDDGQKVAYTKRTAQAIES